MSTSFLWQIKNLERELEDNFVFAVYYAVTAIDGPLSSSTFGTINLERGEQLVPFLDLTEEIVLSWTKEKLGSEKVNNIEAALQLQIEEQKNPTKAFGTPWEQTEPT
jgi:hypothetical protein